MEIWNEIRKQIKLETKWYFEPKGIDTDPLVETLKKIFNAPIDSQYSLSGLATTYTNALFKVIDEDSSKKDRISNFEVLKNVEPFLKKILYFKDFEKFLEIKDEQKGLTPILKSCGLNPNNIFMDDEHLSRFTDDKYEYHLIKVFILRNLESHCCELWSSRELEENIGTELIFYMEAICRCKNYIEEKLTEIKNDFSEYIQNEISSFEIWASRFVATDTVEDFSVFESYAVENITSYDENEEDNEVIIERSGTVDFIRKNKLPEKRMMLWGDAGLGKSTTLQYLTYLDAKSYMESNSREIPVYLPLGMLIDSNETLESCIFNKLNVGVEDGKTLLENGDLNIYLDGVNEIPENKTSDILSKRIREIQLLIDSYRKTLLIISNRPERYNQFKNIPVFRLQPMDHDKIMRFIDRNTNSETVKKLIKDRIQSNHRLLDIISTPLMTTRLISIVQEFNEVPESEGLIIKQFLDALYKRERIEKQDAKFDADKIKYLLTTLASYGFIKNGTNSGINRFEVLQCFSSCLEKLHFEYDTVYALDVLIKMGVLSCDGTGEVVVFSHQAYQDYYLSIDNSFLYLKSEKKKLIIQNINEKNRDEERLLFEIYKLTRVDNRYDKVIVYYFHVMGKNKQFQEMKKLAKYNIYLATKIMLTGEYNSQVEDFLIEQAVYQYKQNAQNEKEIVNKINCMKTLLALKRETEYDLFVNDILYNNRLLFGLLKKISSIEYIQLLRSFLNYNHVDLDTINERLLMIARRMNAVFKMIDWDDTNESFLFGLITVLERSEKGFIGIVGFSIPKKYIDVSHFLISSVEIEHLTFGERKNYMEFVSRYSTEDNLFECISMMIDFQDGLKTLECIYNYLYENDKKLLKKVSDMKELFRAYIFTLLPINIRIKIALKIGFYYYKRYSEAYVAHNELDFKEFLAIFELNLTNFMGYFSNYNPKKESEICKYTVDTEFYLRLFINRLRFKTFPIYIDDKKLNYLFSLYHLDEERYVRTYMDQALGRILLQTDKEYYFSLGVIDNKEYICKCIKNRLNNSKEWFLHSIVEKNKDIENKVQKEYSKNYSQIIKRINEINLDRYDEDIDYSIERIFNIIQDINELNTPAFIYLIKENNIFIMLVVLCMLKKNNKYQICKKIGYKIYPKYRIKKITDTESEYIAEKFTINDDLQECALSKYEDFFFIEAFNENETEDELVQFEKSCRKKLKNASKFIKYR